MKAVTAATMQQLDSRTILEYGVAGLELMERAGERVTEEITARFSASGSRSALIVAGKGNNGGDGFVIARLLAEADWQVGLLLFAGAGSLAGDAKANFDRLPATVRRWDFPKLSPDEIREIMQNAALLVDALFGTGLTSDLSGIYTDAVRLINSCGRPVVAVDIPSGVDASTGRVLGEAVRADLTVTFGAAKVGQVVYPGIEYVGELVVADIGIPADLLDQAPHVEYIDGPFAATLLRPRSRNAHKGSNGHALIVAGSCGKSGAAAMAANSAMRSGAGLVTLAVPGCIHPVVEQKTSEAMTTPLPDSPDGILSLAALEKILTLLAARDVAAVGPGLGLNDATVAVVRAMVASATVPLLLDADALNALARDSSCLKMSAAPALVLTPHPGEMARLAGVSTAAIESDRIGAARSFASAHNCYLLLKGAATVIAAPDGRVAINGSGNPGMASGGMGDVLAGVITALLGQGYEPFEACCVGAYCHGLSGDLVAAEKGEIGLIATDVQEMLPCAFKRLVEMQKR